MKRTFKAGHHGRGDRPDGVSEQQEAYLTTSADLSGRGQSEHKLERELERTKAALAEAVQARREAESTLHEHDEMFRTAFEEAPIAMTIVGVDLRIKRVNRMVCEITRKPAKFFVGTHIDAVFPPGDDAEQELMWRNTARLVAGEIPSFQMEKRYQHARGDVIWSLLSLSCVRNEVGDVTDFIVQQVDIDEVKRAETELQRRQEELCHVQRLGMVGEMASAFAHEVQQPLAAMANYAAACENLLRSPDMNTSKLLSAAHSMTGQAKRASDVVSRVIRFAKTRESNKEPADLGNIAEEVVAVAQAEARYRGILLRREGPRPFPQVYVDTLLVEQALLNLIRNAFDAIDATGRADGSVVIHCGPAADPALVAVEIRDNGVGIAAEMKEVIFDHFVTTKTDGLGMGLAISQTIVEEHGGRLCAASNGEGGASFTVTLPTWRPEELHEQ